ncbi:division plane positioning ATPase MipZ [Methylobacterium sp. D53M]
MQTIAVISQKGGSGKSTLGMHLAVSAEQAGLRAAILDTDPQSSAHKWFERREAPAPVVHRETDGDMLAKLAARARSGGIDFLLIDTPGKAEGLALAAAELADLILIPTRPTQLDLETLGTVKRIARLAERMDRAVVVLSQCPPASRRTSDGGHSAVTAQGLEISPVRIHQRADFAYAISAGLTAPEHEPNGKASAEAGALFSWVRERLARNLSE